MRNGACIQQCGRLQDIGVFLGRPAPATLLKEHEPTGESDNALTSAASPDVPHPHPTAASGTASGTATATSTATSTASASASASAPASAAIASASAADEVLDEPVEDCDLFCPPSEEDSEASQDE